jgi:ATP-dependent Clp protease ATP-binding subunit ClpA
LELSEATLGKIASWCLKDLANGGRGIGNRLESVLIHPLARALFDRREAEGDRVVVSDIVENTGVFSVVLR